MHQHHGIMPTTANLDDVVPPSKFSWISRPMGARVDLDDREAIYEAIDSVREAEPPPDKSR